jgi:DNA repair protein RecO (recombination protein O)
MPTERSFRTPAIILKRRDFGEADRIVTILTPNHGKLDVIAKGARKPTSHKTGHVELFTRADMLVHRGRGLDIISQVEMNAPYQTLREDLTRGAYANFVAELLDRFAADSEAYHADLFKLVDESLERLCSDDDPRLAVRYYEVRLLDLVGFRPELNECVVSHEEVQPENQFFSYILGGVVTPEYAHEGMSVVPISVTTLKLMRHMQRSPYSQVKSLKIGLALHDDVERVLLGYITYLLERKLQSVEFIRHLRRMDLASP